MRALMIAAVFAVSAHAAEVSPGDESLVSERLSRRAQDVLDGMLGPGRAKALVEVRGERLEIRTQTEIMTPIAGGTKSSAVKEALRVLDLPGYHKNRPAAEAAINAAQTQAFQKDFEHSLRDAGFEIKRIEATVVLDSALSDAEAREAAQLLPQLLRIDGARGDALAIVRAPMRPAWKTAFATPSDWRHLAFGAAGLSAALLIVGVIAAAFVFGARVFGRELTSRRAAEAPSSPVLNDMGEPLPELLPGSPAGLVEPASLAALGRRFDCLEQDVAARYLAEESPADLAQVFAYLAKAAPETASRLFAKLPSDIQAEASAAILRLKSVDPDRLSAIEERLKDLVANGLQGSERLAAILSRFPGDERANLLARLAGRKDAGGFEDVERQLFSFEDLGRLPPSDLRRVVETASHELWGAALRGAPASLVDGVLSLLPDAPRASVREAAATPQPKDRITSARSKLIGVVLDLAGKGRIRLERGAGVEETL